MPKIAFKSKLRCQWVRRGFLFFWFSGFLFFWFVGFFTVPVMAQLPFPLPIPLPGAGGSADSAAAPWVKEIGETLDSSITVGNHIYPYIWGACVVKSLLR
jgi:hypothetical protein